MKTEEYICPYCDERLTENEAEGAVDCGCPSCRHIIDWEESEYPRYPKNIKSISPLDSEFDNAENYDRFDYLHSY